MIQQTKTASKEDAIPAEILLDGFDHIEFYVGNALQASYYYNHAFGFDVTAHRGLETGDRQSVSYALTQDHATLVFTGGLQSDSPIAKHVMEHGDGVKTIAFRARDAKVAWETAVARGAKSIQEPLMVEDEHGKLIWAAVAAYGDTIHKFIQRDQYKDNFLPGFQALSKPAKGKVGLATIDHCVGNVGDGGMELWKDYYKRIFGFYVYQEFKPGEISTQYSGLISVVMTNRSGNIKLPINEPSPGKRKSQIQEFLDYNNAEGVQHLALSTRDIIKSVRLLKEQGVEFIDVPRTYYETLTERVGHIDEDIEELAKLSILVDRESQGYLLQIFTKPLQDRPTLFFEIIQRKGATGFGHGNFKAPF